MDAGCDGWEVVKLQELTIPSEEAGDAVSWPSAMASARQPPLAPFPTMGPD